MKKVMLSFLCAGLLFAACKPSKKTESEMNPLLIKWNTPFSLPPFEQIKSEHYLPAFKEAMRIHKEEIEALINNTEEPTFENTIIALDSSGRLLSQVGAVFFNLAISNTNDEMQKIEVEISPILAAHSDDINMNPALFNKVKKVHDNKDKLSLNEEQKKLLDNTYKNFVRSGINLPEEKQKRMRAINTSLSELITKFSQNLLSETNDFQLIIDNKDDLSGLPESLIQNAEKGGKWIFTLHNPSVIPFLQYADNRNLREKIWTSWTNRANNNNDKDNKSVISQIANLRLEKAQLLGYETYANYILEERMAKNPEAVYGLLNQVWGPAIAKAKKEAIDLQTIMTKDLKGEKLEAWDWRYYTEKLRKLKYDLNAETQKPYFSLPHVREGIFMVSNQLFGLSFEKLEKMPIYHPQVEVWEVKDENNQHVGILYLDYYSRESKHGGAWCTSFQEHYKKSDGSKVNPIVSVVCNFSKPIGDEPALLTYDEAETFFHEFGHVLHCLLADYSYIGTANVPRDFVELPSQIMENWCGEKQVLKMYAKHYKTGEPIPDELIQKINNVATFNQGFATTEYLAASLLDMGYHTIKEIKDVDVAVFEKHLMQQIGLIHQIPPRYRSTYFSHIFDGGYEAGYYGYIWSEVLDADAFQAFVETGNIFDKTTADKFKKEILMKGGSLDAQQMYLNFRGKEPKVDPLLKRRGLK